MDALIEECVKGGYKTGYIYHRLFEIEGLTYDDFVKYVEYAKVKPATAKVIEKNYKRIWLYVGMIRKKEISIKDLVNLVDRDTAMTVIEIIGA